MTDNEKLIEEARNWNQGETTGVFDLLERLSDALEAAEKSRTPTDDEREALADRLARRFIDDPRQLMLAEGTGALHVALSESIRSVIEDVYTDCGDSDPGVLSSNIARRLAGELPAAILADAGFRRSESEPSDAQVKAFTDAGWEHRFMAFNGGWSCKCGWDIPGPKLTTDEAAKRHQEHQVRAALRATGGVR